jgi:hypothetical protein
MVVAPSSEVTIRYTVEEIARKHNLKPENHAGGLRYVGANPYEPGAEEDGFCIFGMGTTLDGRDVSGCGWQRTPRRFYKSRQIAEFEGIDYSEYEASLTSPQPVKGFIDPDKFDNRSLEERGVRDETKRAFRISGPLARESSWGELREFPTFHPNGDAARIRRKYRFPQKQLEIRPDKKPRKSDWDKASEPLGMPVGYGLEKIEKGDVVWLVNSELAVWLFWQEAVRAICPLGEGRNDVSYRKMMEAAKKNGAVELHIMLDNDTGGRAGSVTANKAAAACGLPVFVHDIGVGTKDGWDASDLYEFWRDNFSDEMTLREYLGQVSLASAPQLEAWHAGMRAEADKSVMSKAEKNLGALGRILRPKEKKEKRRCPDCRKYAVIESGNSWLCYTKLEGCGHRFERDDARIEMAAVKEETGDASLELLYMLDAQQLFHTSDGYQYVVVMSKGKPTCFDIRSQGFEDFMRYNYFEKHGKTLKKETLQTSAQTLAAIAIAEGPCLKAHVRTAEHDGKIYIDLANEKGEVVEISPDGWKVVVDYDIYFRRTEGLLPLPVPVRPNQSNDDTWMEFKRLLNYGDERNWMLIVSWIVAALQPFGWSCPVLAVNGEQGSGKTTLSKLCRRTVDPHKAALPQFFKDQREAVISAQSKRVFGLDNQTHMEPWMSNFLAAMVSGNSMEMRKLFTDKDSIIFDVKPAMILNGIPEKIGGQDFSDRCLRIFVPELVSKGYQSETDIFEAHDEMLPRLLCAVFDAMAEGLRNMPRRKELMEGIHTPRLFDFARWIRQCEAALPFPFLTWLASYNKVSADAAGADIEELFPQVVIEFVQSHNGEWRGYSNDLWALLWEFGIQKASDHVQLAYINRSDMPEFEKERERGKLRTAGEQALRRIKNFPQNVSRLGLILTQTAPGLRKNARISCEKLGRDSRGQMWHLHALQNEPTLTLIEGGAVEASNAEPSSAEPSSGSIDIPDGDDPFEDDE